MKYFLKDNFTGDSACYETSLQISENDKQYVFEFYAKNSTFYCPYKNYNENLYEGDVCEVFIGDANDVSNYYEIEISPEGAIFLAKVYNDGGDTEESLHLTYLENDLLEVNTQKDGKNYLVKIAIDKKKLNLPLEKIAFNAFRIDTDGIKQDLHLFSLNPTKCETFHKLGYFVMLKDYLK